MRMRWHFVTAEEKERGGQQCQQGWGQDGWQHLCCVSKQLHIPSPPGTPEETQESNNQRLAVQFW